MNRIHPRRTVAEMVAAAESRAAARAPTFEHQAVNDFMFYPDLPAAAAPAPRPDPAWLVRLLTRETAHDA